MISIMQMVQDINFSQVSSKFTTAELNKNAIRNVCNKKRIENAVSVNTQ